MKSIILIWLVVILAVTVESASHHRRHKASTMRPDPPPVPGGDNDDGDVDDAGPIDWPEPVTIGNFGLPDGFLNGDEGGDGEIIPGRRRGRISHKSRSH